MNRQENLDQLERMQEKLDALPLLAVDRAIEVMAKTRYVPVGNPEDGEVVLDETQTEEEE